MCAQYSKTAKHSYIGNTDEHKEEGEYWKRQEHWRISNDVEEMLKDVEEMLRNAERGRGYIAKHWVMQKGVTLSYINRC